MQQGFLTKLRNLKDSKYLEFKTILNAIKECIHHLVIQLFIKLTFECRLLIHFPMEKVGVSPQLIFFMGKSKFGTQLNFTPRK